MTPKSRKKLGEIFIEKGILTPLALERLLVLSRKTGRRLGYVLEELGLVTGMELAEALAIQYNYRIISSVAKFAYQPQLLRLVSVDTAVENIVFPLKADGGKLGLAMADPTNQQLIGQIEASTKMKVIPFISTRDEIYSAISRHYLNRTPSETGTNTVLVVDDDKQVNSFISGVLSKAGFTVASAEDGMAAYKEVISGKPAVIITEKDIPKLDGYALLSSLRNIPELKLIPVILLSGTATAEDEAAAYEKGFFDFVVKPVKEITLLAKVKRALRITSLVG